MEIIFRVHGVIKQLRYDIIIEGIYLDGFSVLNCTVKRRLFGSPPFSRESTVTRRWEGARLIRAI